MLARSDGRSGIDAGLVKGLIREQFPQWSALPVVPVEVDGWDNRTFHLGDDMTARLPSDVGYALQVAKEHRWLPVLAPQLPLPIPVLLAMGRPPSATATTGRCTGGSTASRPALIASGI